MTDPSYNEASKRLEERFAGEDQVQLDALTRFLDATPVNPKSGTLQQNRAVYDQLRTAYTHTVTYGVPVGRLASVLRIYYKFPQWVRAALVGSGKPFAALKDVPDVSQFFIQIDKVLRDQENASRMPFQQQSQAAAVSLEDPMATVTAAKVSVATGAQKQRGTHAQAQPQAQGKQQKQQKQQQEKQLWHHPAMTNVKDKKPFTCPMQGCNSAHWVVFCPKFLALSPAQRKKAAEDNGVCTTCLLYTHHGAQGCYWKDVICRYKRKDGSECQFKHHALLHDTSKDRQSSDGGKSGQKHTQK